MNTVRNIWNSPYLFWGILAMPMFAMMNAFLNGASAHQLLHPTGEFAARFMIFAMMITPLRMMFGNHNWTLRLMRRRRYLGVAAFVYALAHTVFYVIDEGSLRRVLGEVGEISIWTGWIAFFIFVPLAITSNDWSMRRLRKAWKPLQRWVYLAALLTLAHWIFLEYEIGPALVHFAPLAALQAYRIHRNYRGQAVAQA